MQFQKSLLTATLLAAASLTAVSATAAGTATGNFDVKIKIDSVCNVDTPSLSAADINFGTVAAGATAPQGVSAATIKIACSTNAPYVINLTPTSLSSSDGTGQMKNPAGSEGDLINYQLRKETGAAGAIWGNGGTVVNGVATPVNSLQGLGIGAATNIEHTVYATVQSSTDVEPGDYLDTVDVQVVY